MKSILFLLLVLPLVSFCQRDYDYSFTTDRIQVSIGRDNQPIKYEKNIIEKIGNNLIVKNYSTSEKKIYRIYFKSFDSFKNLLEYETNDGMNKIFVDASDNSLEIVNKKGEEIHYFY